jgi:hypothetical protein
MIPSFRVYEYAETALQNAHDDFASPIGDHMSEAQIILSNGFLMGEAMARDGLPISQAKLELNRYFSGRLASGQSVFRGVPPMVKKRINAHYTKSERSERRRGQLSAFRR